MIKTGDKIIVLVSGRYGVGLVRAVVDYIYMHAPEFSATPVGSGIGIMQVLNTDAEGVAWIRGEDLDSEAASALLVAGSLSR